MWFNHITGRSAGLSHASRLLVSKWITDLLNQGQFACWHEWIDSLNKQKQVAHRASAREVPLCGRVTGGVFRVLMRKQSLCHSRRPRDKSAILPFYPLLLYLPFLLRPTITSDFCWSLRSIKCAQRKKRRKEGNLPSFLRGRDRCCKHFISSEQWVPNIVQTVSFGEQHTAPNLLDGDRCTYAGRRSDRVEHQHSPEEKNSFLA